MICTYIFADQMSELNCSKWNCLFPAAAINRTMVHKANVIHISKFIENSEETQKIIAQSDIIIIERNLFDDCNTMMQFWKIRSKKFLAIWDDAYPHIQPQNASYRFWSLGEVSGKDQNGNMVVGKMNIDPITQIGQGLLIAQSAIFPSRVLADDWDTFCNGFCDMYVTHNYIDIDKYLNVKPLIPHDKSIILGGWHGSMSHVESFEKSGALEALIYAANKYDNFKILIGGDKRVFDLFEGKVPNNKKIFQPFVPEEYWTSALRSFDIALAPLATPYDARRSWIRLLEYCAVKSPWICSDFPTYEEFKGNKDHSTLGKIIPNSIENWKYSLIDMIENIDTYRKFAEGEPFKFALQNTWDGNIHKLLDIYQQVIDKPYKKIDISKLKYMDIQ